MDLYIRHDRYLYTARTTIGKLYLPKEIVPFCFTLEDTVRAFGIKVPGETAIPEDMYKVIISLSRRFKRLMPMLYTESNRYEILSHGIGFKGVRLHGGNDHTDTAGCPLVAFNYISDTKIQGTAEKALTSKIQDLLLKGDVFWKITNLPQA